MLKCSLHHEVSFYSCGSIHTDTMWVSGSILTRFAATNLEQVVGLLCAPGNSASYPEWYRKCTVVFLAWNGVLPCAKLG